MSDPITVPPNGTDEPEPLQTPRIETGITLPPELAPGTPLTEYEKALWRQLFPNDPVPQTGWGGGEESTDSSVEIPGGANEI